MAREFGGYSPAVPLGVTWEESILLEDESGAAVDLTGYDVRAQLRAIVPGRAEGVATSNPILELTTVGFYDSAPAWPVVEGLAIPTPANGTITLKVDVDDLWTLSPSNAKAKLIWSIVLIDEDVDEPDYVLPVVQGKVIVLPAKTL